VSYVLGLDLSLTGTGIATIPSDMPPGRVDTERVVTTGRRGDDLDAMDSRMVHITDQVSTWLNPLQFPVLVIIEGPALGAVGGSTWDRAGLWWRVVHKLLGYEIPLAVVHPNTRAKWAAGRGNAKKDEVAVAVSRLWPQVPECSNDEWDALALATMGAQHLGWDVPQRAHHAQSRAVVDWPEGLVSPPSEPVESPSASISAPARGIR
jgi:Holliday junction resolvasome RuvABC endonuclease subunit